MRLCHCFAHPQTWTCWKSGKCTVLLFEQHWEARSRYIWHLPAHRGRRRRSFVTRTVSSKGAAHRFPRNQHQRRPFHWLAVIYFSDWLSTVTLFMSGMITDSKQVNIVHSQEVGKSNAVRSYMKLRKLQTFIPPATLKKSLKTASDGHRQWLSLLGNIWARVYDTAVRNARLSQQYEWTYNYIPKHHNCGGNYFHFLYSNKRLGFAIDVGVEEGNGNCPRFY